MSYQFQSASAARSMTGRSCAGAVNGVVKLFAGEYASATQSDPLPSSSHNQLH